MLETEAAHLRYAAGLREQGRKEVLFSSFSTYGNINTQDSPYSLHVNTPVFVAMLKEEFGMNPRDIGKINIHIVGERPHKLSKEQRDLLFDPKLYKKDLKGDHDYPYALINAEGESPHIMIYAFKIWANVNKDKDLMVSQSRRTKTQNLTEKSWQQLEKRTKSFLIDTRMKKYLEKAASERVQVFLSRLIVIKANKTLRETLIHESSHAREYQSSWARVQDKLRKIGLINWFLEELAERDEERLTKKMDWHDIVEFKVNKKEKALEAL